MLKTESETTRRSYYFVAGLLAILVCVALGICVVLLDSTGVVDANLTTIRQASLASKSDSELIQDLGSEQGTDDGLSGEIVKRGARMVPLLVKLKGDQRPYWRVDLGHHLSAQAVTLPHPNAKPGETVTVEVAALYLVCAIYHNTSEFAQSPYLTDLTIPPTKRQARNYPNLVSRAWESVDPWSKELQNTSIDELRRRQLDPLRGSDVAFW